MDFKLDYDQLVILDAEGLAETGINEAYQALLPTLRQYAAEPSEIEEIIDEEAPSYAVRHGGQTYVIYSPELLDVEGQSWGRAAHAFFSIVNTQLMQSEYRFYAISGGNDLGGMFLKPAECEAASGRSRRRVTGRTSPRSNTRGTGSTTTKGIFNFRVDQSSIAAFVQSPSAPGSKH